MEKSTNLKRILWVVYAALLLALIVLAQTLSKVIPASVPVVSQLVTGSLVNLVLIVGAATAGFSATAVAAVLSPVLAFSMGQMPFAPMIPVILLGNLIIVAIAWAFLRKDEKRIFALRYIAGVIVGAAAKCAFLWAATALIVAPILSKNPKVPVSKLLLMFSWPQGVTALIGGILALLVLPAIRAYRRGRN